MSIQWVHCHGNCESQSKMERRWKRGWKSGIQKIRARQRGNEGHPRVNVTAAAYVGDGCGGPHYFGHAGGGPHNVGHAGADQTPSATGGRRYAGRGR